MSRRPPVSVIVPFHGDRGEAVAVLETFELVRRAAGDELIVADNTTEQVVATVAAGRSCLVVPATEQRSPDYARNKGAEHAANQWLLFVDADCRPSPTLIDDYFYEPIADECGAVAGRIVGARDQAGLVARYPETRQALDQALAVRHPRRPFAVTANLLVRRAAWEAVGGLLEDSAPAGADVEFCWRLQDAGWLLVYRERPTVEHRHRERLGALLRQTLGYGAGRAWLNRRYPGTLRRPRPVREVARSLAGTVAWAVSGRFERAGLKALDGVVAVTDAVGYLRSYRTPGTEPCDIAVLCDTFPKLSETFVVEEVRALERLGLAVRVEALARPVRPARGASRGLRVSYLEDDGYLPKLGALARLLARHPLRCVADLVRRQPLRREEQVLPLRALAPLASRIAGSGERHLHAHFAASAALTAMRLGRLCGVPYSVTAHAYDIYSEPRNLREKLERAAFATSGCDYTVEDLRALVRPKHRARIHKVVMGVDGQRFRRRVAHSGGRTVIAVGRLVEKKGFRYLVEAAALLERRSPLERVLIVGEGPLRRELGAQIAELGLAGRVELAGAREPEEVRALVERSDLLAAPCVVAADGDRDSMPVTVKEALALELPVVVSDEVGLPELVKRDFGRLVPPGDPEALTEAIEELLALPVAERAAMGRAGRAFVLEHANVERETGRLVGLIAEAGGLRPRPDKGGR